MISIVNYLFEIKLSDSGAMEKMSNVSDRYRSFGFKNLIGPTKKIGEISSKAFKISDRAKRLAKGETTYQRKYDDKYKNNLLNSAKSISEKPIVDRKELFSHPLNWDRAQIKSIVRNSSKVQKNTDRKMLSSLKKQ